MPNQQLVDYIKQQISQGVGLDVIRSNLISKGGWVQSEVDQIISQINQPAPVFLAKKKHRVRTIIIVLVCILAAVYLIFCSIPRILNIFYHDIPPIDDSDLALQKINLSDSVNGYVDVTNAISVMYAPSSMTAAITDMSVGNNWNDATATMLVSKNAQALVYFGQAARKPQFQWPGTADPANISPDLVLTPLNDWRTISRINSIYAMALAKQGKDAAALDAAMNSVSFGQKIEDSQDVLIGYLVGLSLKTNGLTAIQKIISSSKLASADIQPYINEMNKYVNDDSGLITAFKAEYQNLIWTVSPENLKAMLLGSFDPQDLNTPQDSLKGMTPNQYASKINASFYFQPNKTKLLFANYVRDEIRNAPTSCGVTPQAPLKLLAPRDPVRMWLEPNFVGEVLHDMTALSLDDVNRVKCADEAKVSETQILLALRAYENATKSLPTSLGQLIPAYFPAIPTDPFNKQPLQYSLQNKTIFSSYATSTITIDF